MDSLDKKMVFIVWYRWKDIDNSQTEPEKFAAELGKVAVQPEKVTLERLHLVESARASDVR